jgi:hypothetical protein
MELILGMNAIGRVLNLWIFKVWDFQILDSRR